MGKFEYQNAENVLHEVEKLLEFKKENPKKLIYINDVYDKLSIFDWWKNVLSIHNLEDMRSFLKEAIKLGCTGYVCFKVGRSGHTNGMWAYTEESNTGFSPKDCPFIYRSFTPDYTTWSYTLDGHQFFPLTTEDYPDYECAIPYKSVSRNMMEKHITEGRYLVDKTYLLTKGVA